MIAPPAWSGPITPGMLSILPILYVAWSDTVLSPSEMNLIHEQINQMPHLTPGEKKALINWADPTAPPGEDVFREWVKAMQEASGKLTGKKRLSLAKLGLEMAEAAARKGMDPVHLHQVLESLQEMETALGVTNPESYRILAARLTNQGALRAEDQPSFSVKAMTDVLDDDYALERQRLRRLLEDPAFKYRYTRDKDRHRDQVLAWCRMLAQQGYGAISYPEAYGGRDDMGRYAAIFETLAHHDLSLVVKFGVQFGLFGGAILHLGTKMHHDAYLHDAGTLTLPGCFAMTETGHGSDVRGIKTTAVYDPVTREFVINSSGPESNKEYIGNALHSRMAVVFAQLHALGIQHGVHAFLVPMRDKDGDELPGIRVEDNGYKIGLNGVDNGKIWYTNVRIPRENLLNRFGSVAADGSYTSPIENPDKRFFTMLSTLVGGRICVGRAGLSAAKSGLTIAIRYALRRRQFSPGPDQPETLLLDYPTHHWRLLPRLATAYALDFALTDLTRQYQDAQGGDLRKVETKAAGLKAYTTSFAVETLQVCREACGGKGYLYENRFADLKGDTDIFTTFEGDNTVLWQLVAKGLLSDFRQQLHDQGNLALVRLIMERVTTSMTEKNPIITRNTDAGHLMDAEFLLSAFKYRERKLVQGVAERMRNYLRKHMDAYDAFLRCQMHMVHAAKAFVEREVLEQFIKVVVDQKDPAIKGALQQMCRLYGLYTILEHKGWYLEAGYLEPVKTKAIRRMVQKLCAGIRVDALALVDAFAISDVVLGAPIAIE